jgi:hypothetical protein
MLSHVMALASAWRYVVRVEGNRLVTPIQAEKHNATLNQPYGTPQNTTPHKKKK